MISSSSFGPNLWTSSLPCFVSRISWINETRLNFKQKEASVSLKFKYFFELMTADYASTPDDLNESNGEVISFGKLIADTIDDAPKSYREFERNLLSDDAPGELGENCDETGNEEEQYNDVNEHDVHFDISNEKETTIVVKAAGNDNDTFTVSDDTIENEVRNILTAITIIISERETVAFVNILSLFTGFL